MIVSLIVAMDERRGIGFQGRIPWHLSADLKHFKALTMGHHLVVGRKTFASIGRPLPGRQTIVVTRNSDYQAVGCLVTHSVDAALNLARERGESDVFIGGGAEIYTQALPLADQVYLTQVHTVVQADTFFPDIDRSAWTQQLLFAQSADEKNDFRFDVWLLKKEPQNH